MKPGQRASQTMDARHGLAALRDAQVSVWINWLRSVNVGAFRVEDRRSCRSSLLPPSDRRRPERRHVHLTRWGHSGELELIKRRCMRSEFLDDGANVSRTAWRPPNRLALASLDRACRHHCPDVSATLTTTAFARPTSTAWGPALRRLVLCRVADAGHSDPSTRANSRRRQLAKGRNRGRWGAEGAAGAMGI